MTDRARDAGFEAHRREQRRAWLRLTYLERLRWLDQAKRFAARALGAARSRRDREPEEPIGTPGPAPGIPHEP
jgi:hypothetical protein